MRSSVYYYRVSNRKGQGEGEGRTNGEAGKFWYKIINREGAINEEVGKNFQS